MILVDTSVWVDHFRTADPALHDLLLRKQVVVHPFIIGELALGPHSQREAALGSMPRMRSVIVADDPDVWNLIERHALFRRGIGYIDVHLLASARLTPDTQLWSRDRRLNAAAEALGVAARLAH